MSDLDSIVMIGFGEISAVLGVWDWDETAGS